MTAAARDAAQIDAPSPALLGDPLGFFLVEHGRQRQLFSCIERLATAATLDGRLAAEVLAFLRDDMPLHRQDEEQDLFPLMRRKCPPEDAIEEVLSALAAEQAIAGRLAEVVTAGIAAAVTAGRPIAAQSGLRAAMAGFVRSERRHLALANCIVLPLARRRLRSKDLACLSAAMAARRGAAPAGPEEAT